MSKLERAQAGYDVAFERELAEAIIGAIADASMIDGIIVIRTGEMASALTTVLACALALSPAAVRSPKAIREVANAVRRKLLTRVRQAEMGRAVVTVAGSAVSSMSLSNARRSPP
jgi:hypothetical protein